jgi:N-acyl-D-amino-acid deacylase
VFDLSIRNGQVAVAGEAAPRAADVAVHAGRIAAVGPAGAVPAARTLDATGCWVLPGFVDVHSHTDEAALRPGAASKLRQGITTEICGQCGGAAAPLSSAPARAHRERIKREEDSFFPSVTWASLGQFLDRLDGGVATNQVTFAGWWTVHDDEVRFGAGGLGSALAALERARAEGAAGVSIHQESASWRGLDGAGRRALFAAAAGSMVSVHLAHYDDRLVQEIAELVDLSAHVGVRLQLSHLKILGPHRDELLGRVLEALQVPNVRGDVTPYTSACTRARSLGSRIRADAGALDDFASVQAAAGGWRRKRPPAGWTPEAAAELGQLLEREPGALVIADGLHDRHVNALLAEPHCFVGTDASAVPEGERGRVHPRAFDAFPVAVARRLAAGASITELAAQLADRPARWFDLEGRGRIAPGWAADLVVLEPQARRPRHVIVNGTVAVAGGATESLRAGRVLRSGAAS